MNRRASDDARAPRVPRAAEDPRRARAEILCVGEVLWDALPAGLFLGGAPVNVAVHLHTLGEPVAVVTRVGADRLGDEIVRRLRGRGLATSLIQTDPLLPTGFVRATIDARGNASYEILEPVAWDALECDDGLLQRASSARALVFGSLAQRDERTRATIEALCDACGGRRVFDVNLRPPFDGRDVVERSLRAADVVKLNEAELTRLASWFGLPAQLELAARGLADAFDCETVCVTRGGRGAALLNAGRWAQHAGFRVTVRDTVGAGDAFLAALLSGLLAGLDDADALERACRVGAYVATQAGATPVYERDVFERPAGAAVAAAVPVQRSESTPVEVRPEP